MRLGLFPPFIPKHHETHAWQHAHAILKRHALGEYGAARSVQPPALQENAKYGAG